MATFTEGLEKAEQAAQASKTSFYRVKDLVVKDDGQEHWVRIVLPRQFTADMHWSVPTKPKPDAYTGKWPEKMSGICQNDIMFRIRDDGGEPTDAYEEGYGECLIHAQLAGQKNQWGGSAARPQSQVFGLGVLVEPILDPVTGNPRGFKDRMTEFKDSDGKAHRIPEFVVINQRYDNFWGPAKANLWKKDGPHPICDGVWKVWRKGGEYYVSDGPSDPNHRPGTPSWSRYEEALALIGFDLGEHILHMASPDYYARFFDPNREPKGGYGRQGGDGDSEGGTAAAPAAEGGEVISDAELAAHRAALKASRSS